VRRYAELQPVFAGPFRAVAARGSASAPGAEVVMTAVVAMPTTFGVLRRLKVAHWDFLCLVFAHIAFLQ